MAKIWVSSDAPDTDFTAKLTDVYPDGRSILICDGICRARYRDSFAKPKLLEPDTVYPLTIDLWSTSIVLNRGHRLRLAISSSNAPRFEPNPNTAGGPESGEPPRAAENRIHFGTRHPSAVILPIRD
jgi:putative CocE/NonD family hydrolase